MKKQTNWTQATTNLFEAIAGVLSAYNAGLNAWIEVQENGKQDNPIMIVNPELNNPFNWTMSYGTPTFDNRTYFLNDTQKDLTENWTACYGDAKAIEAYQTTGKLSDGLSKGMGRCHPVKKTDLVKLRPYLLGVNLWTTYWKPADKIPYRVADPNIKNVFVVCTTHEANPDEKTVLGELKQFINSLEKITL